MREPAPMIQTMTISEVKRTIAHLVNAVSHGETRVIIEQSGVPVAVLVSLEDLERLAAHDARSAERWRVLEAMRTPFRGAPVEEIERETAKAIAEVRAERKAEREAAAKSA